jgi:hypothetical protein
MEFHAEFEGLLRACASTGKRVRALLVPGHSLPAEICAIGADDESSSASMPEFIGNGG